MFLAMGRWELQTCQALTGWTRRPPPGGGEGGDKLMTNSPTPMDPGLEVIFFSFLFLILLFVERGGVGGGVERRMMKENKKNRKNKKNTK